MRIGKYKVNACAGEKLIFSAFHFQHALLEGTAKISIMLALKSLKDNLFNWPKLKLQ